MAEDIRRAMGLAIVKELEGRYSGGKLQVYKLPSGDGGGAFEVAGINERFHPAMANRLKRLIEAGSHAQAEREAADYIVEYTDRVRTWFPSEKANPHIEFLLRDSAFNRGLKGAATILQLALGVATDGVIGPKSKAAFAKELEDPQRLAAGITKARETYERRTYPWKTSKRDESSKFWKGLLNRWAKAHKVGGRLV
jgi:lysozyme family protein